MIREVLVDCAEDELLALLVRFCHQIDSPCQSCWEAISDPVQLKLLDWQSSVKGLGKLTLVLHMLIFVKAILDHRTCKFSGHFKVVSARCQYHQKHFCMQQGIYVAAHLLLLQQSGQL